MSYKVKLANPAFAAVVRFFLGKWLRIQFKLNANNECIKGKDGPFLILANHVTNWDPFALSMYVKKPIHFVTSDTHFRNPLLKTLLLKLVGSIPKSKGVSDLSTIRHIRKIVDQGGNIGIFPEGKRSWDGHSLPIYYSTAKLIKLIKIPVVVAIYKGGYLTRPRWTNKSRKGILHIDYSIVLTKEQIKEKTVEEIFKIIDDALLYDEMEWQKDKMIEFRSKKPAQNIEQFLFVCPRCKGIETMLSENDTLECTKCGYSVRLNNYGYFEKNDHKLYFDTTHKWALWQEKYIKELLISKKKNMFLDYNTDLQIGKKYGALDYVGTGNLLLSQNKITYTTNQQEHYEFNIDKITGENIQLNYILEFYYENILYHFTYENRHISAYKWLLAITLIKGGKEEK